MQPPLRATPLCTRPMGRLCSHRCMWGPCSSQPRRHENADHRRAGEVLSPTLQPRTAAPKQVGPRARILAGARRL
eukprot:4273670-Pleurochrysis_carterae.AAC.1